MRRTTQLIALLSRQGGAAIVAPTITSSGALAAAEVGIPQTWAALECDDGGGTVTWSIQSGAPTGLSINSSSGVISGTPTGTVQTYDSLVVRATNEAGYDEETFSLVLAWTPLAIASVKEVWRGDQGAVLSDGTGALENDSPVGYFPALVNSAHHARQAGATGAKPLHKTSLLNSKPGLEYDNADDQLVLDNNLVISGDFSIAFVVSAYGTPTVSPNRWLFMSADDVQNKAYFAKNQGSSVWCHSDSGSNLQLNKTIGAGFALYRWERIGSTMKFYLNESAGVGTDSNFNTSDVTLKYICTKGTVYGFSPNRLCEIDVTPPLAGADLTSFKAYITARYGLTLS